MVIRMTLGRVRVGGFFLGAAETWLANPNKKSTASESADRCRRRITNRSPGRDFLRFANFLLCFRAESSGLERLR